MRAALKNSYVEYILYMGVTEKYPQWFRHQLDNCAYTDESRFTFWVNKEERRPDYYEKQLIEDYSVFIRNSNGDIHITDYDTFQRLYVTFTYDAFTNNGIAAFENDCIEYVECMEGMLSVTYPTWFYEFFTESINFPNGEKILLSNSEDIPNLLVDRGPFLDVDNYGGVSVDCHCVFLRNKFGEVRGMLYTDFLRFYDDNPERYPIVWG